MQNPITGSMRDDETARMVRATAERVLADLSPCAVEHIDAALEQWNRDPDSLAPGRFAFGKVNASGGGSQWEIASLVVAACSLLFQVLAHRMAQKQYERHEIRAKLRALLLDRGFVNTDPVVEEILDHVDKHS
jgi:hypothetical protein